MKNSILGEKDRRLIPRWRGFASSAELSSNKIPKIWEANQPSAPLLENQSDWREEPSLWNALDFIAGAIVEERLDLAATAIEQIRGDHRLPASGAALIERALDRAQEANLPSALTIQDESILQIRHSRRRLSEHQWDAIEWMDLARSFTNLGLLDKAKRCVAAALKIAPSDRFIARAASRFYVHSLEPERALRLLERAGASRDPLLMGPQIAISGILGKGAFFARDGLRMLKADFSDADLSELGAALGTLEVESGKLVHAKKLLRASLSGANENTVAQVEWLNRSRLGEVIDVSAINPPRLYEAGAWSAYLNGDWEEARRLSELWFRDQPFSGNAATVYSYILSDILQEHETALQVLTTALRCNPRHPVLLNNQAVTHIQMGDLGKAEILLSALVEDDTDANLEIIGATRGLLAFRQGKFDEGRMRYLTVIERLLARSDADKAARAATHLAIEEVNFETPFMLEATQRSLALTEGIESPNVLFKVQELEKAVRNLAARSKFRVRHATPQPE